MFDVRIYSVSMLNVDMHRFLPNLTQNGIDSYQFDTFDYTLFCRSLMMVNFFAVHQAVKSILCPLWKLFE